MFSVFEVPNEIEGGIRIHYNFFLLGLRETISHGLPRWGLLIRAAAKAVARGKLFWGEIFRNPEGRFPFLTSFGGNSGSKVAKVKKFRNALAIADVRKSKSVTGSMNAV